MAMRAATSQELAYLRTPGQWSKLFIAGLTTPPTVMAARINQTFLSNDMVSEFGFDTITSGAWTSVIPGMTCWIGSSLGGCDLGQVRVRTITSTRMGIGEVADISWADDLFITVKDEFLLWPKHIRINNEVYYMDNDILYADQHWAFDPVPIMGPDVVLDVLTYPATVTFPEAVDSWAFGTTIETYHFASNAGTWTDHETSGASLSIASYPTNGLIRVALTVTTPAVAEVEGPPLIPAKAETTMTGYRYIYVYDATHRPETNFQLSGNPTGDYDGGGWSFDITMVGNATTIRDRAKVILFTEDYYGNTKVSIGQVAGRENIKAIGYVDGETINYDPMAGTVKFSVKGPQFWLDKMSGFPPGVELKAYPVKWTQMYALTVDKAVWHLLQWRSTATMVMDVRLSGDTRYAAGFIVPTQSLWAQIKEIANSSIFANPGCNRYGQFFLEIEPQLVPPSDVYYSSGRTWATVMEITKKDWQDKIGYSKSDISELGMHIQSGISVTIDGSPTSIYSLSPGHVFKHYGAPETTDRLLLSSQYQANILAGLMSGWTNNQHPTFSINLSANNGLLDVFPCSFLGAIIAAEDTIRGDAYIGNLIPRSVSFEYENGYFTTAIDVEAESFPDLAVNGDIPITDPGGGGGGGGIIIPLITFPPIIGIVPPFPPDPPVVPPDPTTCLDSSPPTGPYALRFDRTYIDGGLDPIKRSTKAWFPCTVRSISADYPSFLSFQITNKGLAYEHLTVYGIDGAGNRLITAAAYVISADGGDYYTMRANLTALAPITVAGFEIVCDEGMDYTEEVEIETPWCTQVGTLGYNGFLFPANTLSLCDVHYSPIGTSGAFFQWSGGQTQKADGNWNWYYQAKTGINAHIQVAEGYTSRIWYEVVCVASAIYGTFVQGDGGIGVGVGARDVFGVWTDEGYAAMNSATLSYAGGSCQTTLLNPDCPIIPIPPYMPAPVRTCSGSLIMIASDLMPQRSATIYNAMLSNVCPA